MPKLTSYFFLLLFLSFLVSCTRNEDQREFEQEAYSSPENITKVTSENDILEVDENDWRTSPLFQGLIEIAPPFPNPTTSDQNVQFEVSVTGVQSVTGIEVIVLLQDVTSSSPYNSVYFDSEVLPPGLTPFQVNPIEFGRQPTPQSARGLHRIIILDGRQRVISYGDIEVK